MTAKTTGSHSSRPTVSTFPWLVGAYASLVAAILVVLVIAGWGVYLDFEESRKSLLQSEINRIRSHGLRTVLRIQASLSAAAAEENAETPKHADADASPLTQLKEEVWLREHWEQFTLRDTTRLYSAVVDNQGNIIAHTERRLEGSRLPATGWYSSIVEGFGEDAVVTDNPLLTGGPRAIDVSVPIEFKQQELGTYHSSFNLDWFEGRLAEKRTAVLKRWGLAFAIISAVMILAGVSLFHVTRKLSQLHSALALGHVRRLADLGQLAGGIAHEVRNPLNAIRLNLHVIDRLLESQSMADDRTHTMINESVREMDRVDGLLRMLLNYARPDKPRSEIVDLREELPTVAEFIRPIIERDGVRMDVTVPQHAAMVTIDRSRFRQIVINLLKNAAEASGPDGHVEALLRTVDDAVELSVSDHGEGVDPQVKERIFDPFFTTKDVGTGLGLTLVKRYVEEANGEIDIRSVEPHGAEFIVRLPLCKDRAHFAGADHAAVPDYA